MAANMSWIKKFGLDIVHGFEWLASDKGKAVLAAGETAVEVAFPASEPLVELFKAWLGKIQVVEAKGAAAASLGANVTGAQKAVAAIGAVAPDVEAILQKYKYLPLSTESLAKINDAVLTIANALEPAP